jgi:hypothetical protein
MCKPKISFIFTIILVLSLFQNTLTQEKKKVLTTEDFSSNNNNTASPSQSNSSYKLEKGFSFWLPKDWEVFIERISSNVMNTYIYPKEFNTGEPFNNGIQVQYGTKFALQISEELINPKEKSFVNDIKMYSKNGTPTEIWSISREKLEKQMVNTRGAFGEHGLWIKINGIDGILFPLRIKNVPTKNTLCGFFYKDDIVLRIYIFLPFPETSSYDEVIDKVLHSIAKQ